MHARASRDVVIVGGGVIGLASAWEAAKAGLDVAIADPAPRTGASWAAAGMLAPVTEAHFGEEALLELNLASSRLYAGFVRTLEAAADTVVGHRVEGTLIVARDNDDNAVLQQLFAYQQRLGLDVRRLRSRACRELEPGLAVGVRGGVLAAGDHQVDNRALVSALEVAARRAGVGFVAERVQAVETEAGAVVGVRLASGSAVAAGAVVIAAGCGSGGIDGVPDLAPVRPVKGQLLHLRGPADPALLRRTVRGLEVYLVPRSDGRLVVGATMEERGSDTSVTAGAVYDLLRRAHELVPGITELELGEVVAGLRPTTPDNAPLIGPAGPSGLLFATGHFRNGILLTPITAQTVVAHLTGGPPPAAAQAFTPSRFAPTRSAAP